ncbi:hypothetical protein CLU79DRAFT_715404 [Phycomyces nitens]|nr:hypothetical protein CLU79DRAFT_715404 [Phycomyces nitens]
MVHQQSFAVLSKASLIRNAILGLAIALWQVPSALAQETNQTTPTSIIPSLYNNPAEPTIEANGFDAGDNGPANDKDESWLKHNNRYVFVIIICLFVFGLLLWYVIRSVRGMRTRLQNENNNHALMMQQVNGRSDHHRVIPESVPIPMDGYKVDGYPVPAERPPPHTHRY